MSRDYPAKSNKPAKQKPTGKNELARALEQFAKIPFPERSEDETADELHAELLLYDSAIGEAVLAILHGEHVPKEDLRFDVDLRTRLEDATKSDNPVTAADTASYLAYMDQLEDLLRLARAATIKKK